jgi:hypothetical protein
MEMDVTFCKCNYLPFTFYLAYASLHHTLLDILQLSNGVKLIMADGAFCAEEAALNIPMGSAGHGHGQAPCGNASPPPPCPSVSLVQLLMMQNKLMSLLV